MQPLLNIECYFWRPGILSFLFFFLFCCRLSMLMLCWCKKRTITWDLMTESSDAVVFLYKTRTLAHNQCNFTLCSLPFAALNFSKGCSIYLWFVTLFEQFFVLSSRFMIYLLFNHPLRDLWLTNAKLLSNNTLGSTLLITCFNYLNFELSSICMTLLSSLLFCSTVFCYSSISMFY